MFLTSCAKRLNDLLDCSGVGYCDVCLLLFLQGLVKFFGKSNIRGRILTGDELTVTNDMADVHALDMHLGTGDLECLLHMEGIWVPFLTSPGHSSASESTVIL